MGTDAALKTGGCFAFGARPVALCCPLLSSNPPFAPRSEKEIQAALDKEKESKFFVPGMC